MGSPMTSCETTLALASLVALAACASSTPVYPAVPASALRASASKGSDGDLFVSNFYKSQVLIYPAGENDPYPTGSVTDGVSYPYNLAVDKHGTLYVQNNNNTVTVYPEGSTSSSETLTEPQEGYGTGICVTVGSDETVYTVDHLVGQIYVFKKGDTSPSTTLYASHAFGVALDSRNDLYVGWAQNSSGGPARVDEFKHGSTRGKDLGIEVKYEGGLAVDKDDNLLVGDQGNRVIDVFKKGATTPFRTISTYPAYPYQFAFDRNDKYLYLVSGTPAEVYVYDYKKGKLAWTDTQGLQSSGYAEGVALSPAQPQ